MNETTKFLQQLPEKSRAVVYVADDDPGMRLPAFEVLSTAGFEVEVFERADTLLARCEIEPPDLLLLDVEMPGLNGFAACQHLRQQSRTASLPIVMITGHDDAASIDAAYLAGATDFMAKPVNWQLLGHRLRYVLRAAQDNQNLVARENESRALLSAIPDAIVVLHTDGSVLRSLRGAERNSQLLRRLTESVFAPQFEQLLQSIRRSDELLTLQSLEVFLEGSGGPQVFEVHCSPLGAGEVLMMARDISERKIAERRIHRLAYYDALTGLPNREKFTEDLERTLQLARLRSSNVAALYLNVDRFKRINDTFGHTVGDGILRAVADRLKQFCDAQVGQQVSRLGGDEFTIVIDDVTDVEQVERVSRSIIACLAEPVSYRHHEFVVTPSIGVALFPRHAATAEDLLKNADAAMQAAKAAGRNGCAVYSHSMNARLLRAAEIENSMRKALERDEIQVAYQPKRSVVDGTLRGAEALARWYHPERGLIAASEFIPIAEETGLIVEVGNAVLRQVARQLALWRARGFKPVPIAVNISALEFGRGDIAGVVSNLIRAHGLQARDLQFEITEGVLLQATQTVSASIAALRLLGCRISIDDFGTGYSSMSYLQNLKVDALKIDQSFVRRLPEEHTATAICDAVIALGKGLRLEVIAEGVETAAQLAYLKQRGCDTVQGFLTGRPMWPTEFEKLLTGAPRDRESERTA